MTDNKVRIHQPGLPEPHWVITRLIPIAVYPTLIAFIFIYYPFWEFMKSKEGAIEWLSVAFLLTGVVVTIIMLRRHRAAFPRRWLTAWFAIAALGMVFVAGEEMSWGQHFGLWQGEDIPEAFREINDQNETNIHNIVGIGNPIDRGSTSAVVLGVFFAFFILPIIQRLKRETMTFDNPGYWFWPTRACLCAALGVLIIPFPKRIYEFVTGQEGSFDWRHSEIHEFYIALLMMTYTISVYTRLRAYARSQGATGDSTPAAPPAA